MKKRRLNLASKSPYIILLMGFAILILVGSLLFMLPFATKEGQAISYIDSLFLSTSAICVTGLVSSPLPLAELLSPFGCIILLLLVEVGGLGFITLVTFAFSLMGKKAGVSTNLLLKEAMNQNSYQELIPLGKKIVLTSFLFQGIGVIFNTVAFCIEGFNFFESLWYSIFHTISAFNNAGFDIFGPNSLILFKDDVFFNIVTMILIVLGGIGFIVIDDIVTKKSIKKLSIHSKLVLSMTLALLTLGTLVFKFSMSDDITWLQAMFTSVTCRTAGFTTLDLSTLSPSAYIMAILLMLVGASPCSTGGGVKTTTFLVMLVTVLFYARGQKPRIFKRKIAEISIVKAFVLFGVAILMALTATLIIGISQPELEVSDVLFEVISGFSTTGLSLGITTQLNWFSKLVICLMMFLGRIGMLTIMGVLNRNWMSESKENIQYVEERIIVG